MTTTAFVWGPATSTIFTQGRTVTVAAGAQPERTHIYQAGTSPPQGTWGVAYVTGTTLKLALRNPGGQFTDSGADTNTMRISIDGGDFVDPDDFVAADRFNATVSWDLGDDTTHLVTFRTYLYAGDSIFDVGDTFLWITGAAPALSVSKDWAYPGDASKCATDTPLAGPATGGGVPLYGPVQDFGAWGSSNPMGMAVRADWIECWISTTDVAVMVSIDGAPPVIYGGIGFPVGDNPPITHPGKTFFKLNLAPGIHDIVAICAVGGNLLAVGGKFNGEMTPPPYVKRMTFFGDSIQEGAGTRAGMVDGTIIPPRIGRIGSPAGISALTIGTFQDRIDGILSFRAAAGPDDVAVIALGHNDGNYWSTQQRDDYNYMIDAILTKGYGKIIARGVFPDNGGGTGADWATINAGIQAVAVAAAAAGKPVEFEDTSTWLNISMIAPHPGWVGYNQISDLALPWLRDNGYALNRPSTLSLDVPAGTVLNAETALVPALNFPAWVDTPVTIDDGHGGAFTPPTATILAGNITASVSYLALVTGLLVLTATSSDPTISGTSKPIFVQPQSLTLVVPGSIVQYVESTNFTISIDGAPLQPVVVTPSDGGAGGTFHPASVTLDGDHLSRTFTYNSQVAGPISFSVANNGGVTNPLPIVRTATALPPIDGDGELASWPAELTAVVPLDPSGDALLPVPFDPGDRARIKVDNTVRSFGRTIATIEAVDFDAASKALGWRVGIVDDRAILDKTNHAAAIHVGCDPASQQNAAFAGAGTLVTPTIRFRFTNGDTSEVSFPFQARQL